jgi:cobaltochelatase CobN
MKPLNLCYYSATASELTSLSQGVQGFLDAGYGLTIAARTQSQLFDRRQIQAFVKRALQADVIFLSLHGGKASYPAFDSLLQEREEKRSRREKTPHLHIQAVGGDDESLFLAQQHADGFGSQDYLQLTGYHAMGGAANLYRLLVFLQVRFRGTKTEVLSPEPQPQEGIYHPDLPFSPVRDDYLKTHFQPDRFSVGIWFHQHYNVNQNLKHIEAMVRCFENMNLNVLAVYSNRLIDESLGNQGADQVVENFFMQAGKPLIHVLINAMSMSLTHPAYGTVYPTLGVPCLQAMICSRPYAVWKQSVQGMDVMDVSYQAAQPEFDGNLITVPVANREEDKVDPLTGALLSRIVPIPERVERLGLLARNWARLAGKANQEKKVAIVFHHYPPRNDRIGCAAGLDSFASVCHLLERFRAEGYRVDTCYENGDALAQELLERMTCDGRYLTYDKMADRAGAVADREQYESWHEALPVAIANKMRSDWGDPPGDLFVHEGRMLFAGLHNGHVFITIQPPRVYLENPEAIYHDLHLSPPHHYLAQYRYIQDVFCADAVIHVGKHGSLEWLPGKALGLSEECYPDLAILDLPNLYPYIINDPSEGTQAKRRSYCCIVDHLTPVFTNAELYDDTDKVEKLLAEYQEAERQDPNKLPVLLFLLWEAVTHADLHHDLGLTEDGAKKDPSHLVSTLHAYLSELADTMINDGLHTLGQAPEGDGRVEWITQLLRLPNGRVPSLREAILRHQGYDYDDLLATRGDARPGKKKKTGGQLIKDAHQLARAMVGELSRAGFASEAIENIVVEALGSACADAAQALGYAAQSLSPNMDRTCEEIDACLDGLSGGFVKPGPSGAPTRGQADILPSGRNFFSLDPRTIPSPAAWEVGVQLGDALMAHYQKEGHDQEQAYRLATYRVFGCPPGTYGAGVAGLIESKNWQNQSDLANNYIRYSAHAYGKGSYGSTQTRAFRTLLGRMDATVKNEDSREYDMMSCTDFYNYYGGLIVAVKSQRGDLPVSMMGDSADPKRVNLRSPQQEAKHVLRARLLNPKWIQGMQRHGYKGAGDLSKVLDIVFGWDATAEVMEDWMYERVASTYALDPAMQTWLKEVNPYALANITDKLLEAIGRTLWQAKAETEESLRQLFLEMEGEIEEMSQ